MRHDHLFFCWLVQCGSENQARGIQQRLEAIPVTSLTFSDTVRAVPTGSGCRQAQPHVVGDYFASVKILSEPSSASFQLLFQRKPDAPRQWKDVMMYVLRMVREGSVRKESPPVQIVLKYRGDAYPPPESGL
jgi:hypothetical protein